VSKRRQWAETAVCPGHEDHSCGKTFVVRGPHKLRCDDCQAEHRREQNRKYQREKYDRDHRTLRISINSGSRQAYHAYTLQWLPPQHFARVVNAILAGEVQYVG